MELSPYVAAVHRDLVAAAEAGGGEAAAAAERLSYALDPSLRLALLDALGAAAAEVGAALPEGGGVEVRLRGRDPQLVVLLPPAAPEPPTSPAPPAAPSTAEATDDSTARLTVRLPDSLKTRIEEAAAREGLSVNGWLVRAAVQSLDGATAAPSSTRGHTVGRRLSGWAR